MEALISEINEGLNVKTVFTIPLLGGIGITETVVVMWIIMAVMVIGSILLTRNLKVTDCSKRQLLLESGFSVLYNFFYNIIGERGKQYIPYLIIIISYIFVANSFGIFGVKPPTKDLTMTGILGIFTIVVVQIATWRAYGFLGWIKSFGKPVALLAPMNVLELIIKPMSLCMRLFGNVLGAFIITELVKAALPMVIPAFLSIYFDFFDGGIQAYVFTFLTALYLKEALE